MDMEEEAEKIKNLFQSIRELETPGRHAPSYCYSRVSYTAFREITALREEGFSMAAICRSLERDGLLPESASPNSLRRAFRREIARRDRAAKIADGNPLNGASLREKQDKQEHTAPVSKPVALEQGKQSSGEDADKLKRLIAGNAKTGSGAIRKLPNGEFEF